MIYAGSWKNEFLRFEDCFINKDRYRHQAGFNLVELMIVIAIMATLAAIAIPAYSHYLNKSRAIAAVVLTEPVRTEVTEYAMMHNGDLTGVDNASLHLDSDDLVNGSKDVTAITIQGQDINQVEVVTTLADNLGTLTWTGLYKNDSMQWSCTYPSGATISHYAPQGCVES